MSWTKQAMDFELDPDTIEFIKIEVANARKSSKGPFDLAGNLVGALYDFDFSDVNDLKPLIDAKVITRQEAVLVNTYLDQGWEISPSSNDQAGQLNENIQKNLANPNWPQGGVGPFGGPATKMEF
jgi:hypothetical protein